MIIRGTTVGTPTAKPDWNETNPNRAGYICNKPDIDSLIAWVDRLDEQMGDIENALDDILAVQNALIGGDSV